jgi:hypothetical protein
MPDDLNEEELRAEAEKRVRERVHLLEHIGTYIVVNGFLVAVWALSGGGYPWFLWVMAGWGVGLLLHIVAYFTGARGGAAQDRMVDKEMRRMRKDS